MMDDKKLQEINILLLREPLLESWLKDVVTFGCIGFLFWLNHNSLGDTTIGYIVAFFMAFVMFGGKVLRNKGFRTSGVYNDPKKAIEFIKQHFPESP